MFMHYVTLVLQGAKLRDSQHCAKWRLLSVAVRKCLHYLVQGFAETYETNV